MDFLILTGNGQMYKIVRKEDSNNYKDFLTKYVSQSLRLKLIKVGILSITWNLINARRVYWAAGINSS